MRPLPPTQRCPGLHDGLGRYVLPFLLEHVTRPLLPPAAHGVDVAPVDYFSKQFAGERLLPAALIAVTSPVRGACG